VSISTSDPTSALRSPLAGTDEAGFSLIELLLGLTLALCLALGVAPVWVSSQSVGVREGDETIWSLQARVAGARFERDLRLAGPQHCPFATGSAVLQATPSQVVLLVATSETTATLLVEWELVNGSLMRRWGACPATLPSNFSHSLYADNKTMLENVDMTRSRFTYLVAGFAAGAPLPAADLLLVDATTVELTARTENVAPAARAIASGPVGR
jgi:type II secretory pathway component PulJ